MAKPEPPDYSIKLFHGLLNQSRPELMPRGAMTACNNIVLGKLAGVETRPGFTLDEARTAVTDAFTMPHERFAYILDNGTLYNDDGAIRRGVRTGMTDTKLAFAASGDTVFYAGGQDAGRADGVYWAPLRVPLPPVPVVYVLADGPLKAGQYQVTQTYRHKLSGVVTSAPPSLNVEVPEGSSLEIHTAPPDGYDAEVYVTERDGTLEKWLGTNSGGVMRYQGQPLGMRLNTYQTGTYPLPDDLPITALAWFDRRLHAACYDWQTDETTVYYSQLDMPQLFRVDTDAYAIKGRVAQMLGVEDGVLIAGSRSIDRWQPVDYQGQPGGQRRILCRFGCPENNPWPIDADRFGNVTVLTAVGLGTYLPGAAELDIAVRHRFQPPQADTASVNIIHHQGQSLAIVTQTGETAPYTHY